jgi:predicted Ser/Thr protein kinase
VEEVRELFPQLEVIEMIGRGGMGAVYKARQKELDRLVALKILPPGIGEDRAFADRFVREAKALAKLNHPNIVTLYEFDQADGLFYFMMEFVDGVNLRQLLHGGRLAPREALAIVPQICDALQYAHDHGIVHRDIKPENILLDRKGHVKVADFGVARLMGVEGEVPAVEGGPPASASVSLTEVGKVIGTPHYMAPEQKERPGEVDHRADIYSLGVVFYQMLTGELPGKRIEAPSKNFHLDVRLDEVVLRALEKEPALRYQQAGQFKTQIETIGTGGEPLASRPKTPVRMRRLAAYESCIDSRRLRDCWIWDSRIVLLMFLVPFIVASIAALALFSTLGPKAMFFQFLGSVGVIPGIVFLIVGRRVRSLKAKLSADHSEACEAVFLRRMNQQPGLAVLYEDRLEFIPVFGAKATFAFRDIVSVRDIQWFNGALLWWKAAFSFSAISNERIQLALPEPVARRWREYWASAPEVSTENQDQTTGQREQRQRASPSLARLALSSAGLSGVLGIVAFCLFPNPPAVLVWSILAAALLGVFLAIPARKSRAGKSAIICGGVNATIWCIVMFAANVIPSHSRSQSGSNRAWSSAPFREAIVSDAFDLDTGTSCDSSDVTRGNSLTDAAFPRWDWLISSNGVAWMRGAGADLLAVKDGLVGYAAIAHLGRFGDRENIS